MMMSSRLLVWDRGVLPTGRGEEGETMGERLIVGSGLSREVGEMWFREREEGGERSTPLPHTSNLDDIIIHPSDTYFPNCHSPLPTTLTPPSPACPRAVLITPLHPNHF